MGGMPEKQSMYEHRIFPDVNPKSLMLRFLHYIVLFPILVFTSTSRCVILVHCYLFISFNYYLLLTQA